MLLLLTIGMAAQAQQKVVIELNDGTSEAYDLADVDSVTYEPKEEVKYYFYAGWELPTSKEELVKLAKEPNGGEVDMTKTYSKSNPLRLYDGELVNSTKSQYYIVIPDNISIYDSEGDASLMDIFDEQSSITIPNHKVYKSQLPMKGIGGIMLR